MKKSDGYAAQHVSSYDRAANVDGHTTPRKARRHFRWWWLLIVILVLGVIVILIVIPIRYVLLPRIAQREVNKSTLELTSQEIANPGPNSFHLTQTTVNYNPGKYRPKLGSFKGALFLEDTLPNIKPFAYITLPAIIADAQTTVSIDQDVNIVDVEQFTNYMKRVLATEAFRVAIRGRVGVKEKKLSTVTVDYNKVVTLNGLNRLAGFNITSLQILPAPEPDGANMLATAAIPNPSKITIHMGNVILDLAIGGQAIGTALLSDLVVRPGTQSYAMRVIANTTLVLGLVKSQYKTAVVPLDVSGRNSTNAAGEHLAYYENAIRELSLRVDLNLGPALQALKVA